MEIKPIYRIQGELHTNSDMDDEETEKFFESLEDLMDKHEVFYLNVHVNPYKQKLTIQEHHGKRVDKTRPSNTGRETAD